jgi:outer membrane receptor protein involved in Fe transport
VYYIDWEDYIINVIRGGVGAAGNAEAAVSKGAEASLGFAATEALTITGILSYTSAELAADEPDLGGTDGTRLPDTPEWQSALDFDYRFNLGELPSYVGAAWRYKGDVHGGFPGYTDSAGTYYPPPTPRVNVSSYQLVDLRAGTQIGPVDVALYVTNLFDEWAWSDFDSHFLIPGGTPTRPRTIGAVVRWNFF